jgi:hypothetical protein
MIQALVRLLIALVVFWIASLVLPLALGMMGVSPPAAIWRIAQILGVVAVIWYTIWGPPVPKVP